MAKGKVLVIGSNATRIEVQGCTAVTGQYLNKTVIPVLALINAGYDVVLATPDGSKPHIDENSRSAQHFGDDETAFHRAEAFFADDPSMNRVRKLRSVIDEGLENYAAVFVPGGQAPVVDLMQDADVGEILRDFHTKGKPTALLCHGPIAIVAAMPSAPEFRAALIAGDRARAARLAKGWQYAGYKMTIFSNAEEKVLADSVLHAKLYFTVADALEIAGGEVITGPVDWEPHVIEDPNSSQARTHGRIMASRRRSSRCWSEHSWRLESARRRLRDAHAVYSGESGMPDQVKMMALLTSKPGRGDELLGLLHGMANGSRAEPGNLRWDIWQDRSNRDRFVLDELYEDETAAQQHRETAHHKAYLARIGDLADRTAVVLDPVQVEA